MRLMPIVGGTAAYYMGFQWDMLPEIPAAVAVIIAMWMFVADIWQDPAPTPTRRQAAELARLTEKVDRQLASTPEEREERLMKAITGRSTPVSPDVLLSEVLEDDDREWLEEQVRLIVRTES